MGKDTERRPNPSDFFAGLRDKSMELAWQIFLQDGQRDDYMKVLNREQYMRFRGYLERYGLKPPEMGTAGRKKSDVPERLIEAYKARNFAEIQRIFDDGMVTKSIYQTHSRIGSDRLFIPLREVTRGSYSYKPKYTKDFAEALRNGGIPVGVLPGQIIFQKSAYYTLLKLKRDALGILSKDWSLRKYAI